MFILEAEELTAYLEQEKLRLCDYALMQETEAGTGSRQELRERMAQTLTVMERSVQKARREPVRSVSGLTGGNACLYESYRQTGKSILGEMASLAAAMALSCSELNASMQCIVACPTAGSCGIVPAVILSCAETAGLDRERMIDGLFTASAVGILIGSRGNAGGSGGRLPGGMRLRGRHGGGRGGGNAWRDAGRGLSCGRHGAEKCAGPVLRPRGGSGGDPLHQTECLRSGERPSFRGSGAGGRKELHSL